MSSDWVVKESKSNPGKFYYANYRTRETRWSNPDPSIIFNSPHPLGKNRTLQPTTTDSSTKDSSCLELKEAAGECLEITIQNLDRVADCVELSEEAIMSPIPSSGNFISNPGRKRVKGYSSSNNNNNNQIQADAKDTTKNQTDVLPSPPLPSHMLPSLDNDNQSESTEIEKVTTATAIANRKKRNNSARSNKKSNSSGFWSIFGLVGGDNKRKQQGKNRRSKDRRDFKTDATANNANTDAQKAADTNRNDIKLNDISVIDPSSDLESRTKQERSENDDNVKDNDDHHDDSDNDKNDEENNNKESRRGSVRSHNNPPRNMTSKMLSEAKRFLLPSITETSKAYTPLNNNYSVTSTDFTSGVTVRGKNSVVLERRIFDSQILIVKTLLTFIIIENLLLAILALCYYSGTFSKVAM